jgi:hypothetical protein
MMHVDIDWVSLNKVGEELCGDRVEIVRREDSDIIVLSDGLGSGVKANILASLTTKIITTMLKEGACIDEAVETIAHTLPICKVRRVAYSTFSILQLFHDGQAYLVEFDNPACVFIRNGALTDIPGEIREIAGKSVRESRFSTCLGDVFALVSDGVVHAGVGAILNLGWQWENVAAFFQDAAQRQLPVPRMVSSIAQIVDSLYVSKPGDDATMVVAQVIPQKEVHLFSGPPMDQSNDTKLVMDWIRGAGRKVVCGGTSAQIAARVLNRTLTTSLEFTDPALPPTGSIPGIDLVTEGVLTLNRTVELLKKWIRRDYRSSLTTMASLNEDNGAARLARILVEECTDLHCYVGKAINPAHQNPNLPMDLSIKLNLLHELTDLMQKLGRRVTVTYY